MADQQVRPTFTVCVANDVCDDLTTGMIYQALPDQMAAREGYLRVVDDLHFARNDRPSTA